MQRANSKPAFIYYRAKHPSAKPPRLAIQIEKSADTYPRAYYVAPATGMTKLPDREKRETIIRVPIDYKGRHHAPDGAIPLNKAELLFVENEIANGRMKLKCTTDLRRGCDLPGDYDPQSARHILPMHPPEFTGNQRIYRVPFSQLRNVKNALTSARNGGSDTNARSLLADDGKTLPNLVEMRSGAYLVYDGIADDRELPIDKNLDLGDFDKALKQERELKKLFGKNSMPGLPNQVDYLKATDAAEINWIKADEADRKSGIIPPPNPPAELEDLYSKNTFRADGRSLQELEELSQRERKRYELEKELEEKIFGPPKLTRTFNINGREVGLYSKKLILVYNEQREAIGIRCGKQTKESGYDNYQGLEDIRPPAGWHEIPSQKGVFAPDPGTNPEDAALLKKLKWPDPRDYHHAFGKPGEIVIIRHTKGVWPRSYRTYPHIHALRDEFGPLYMVDSPTDYKDRVFRPTDSTRMTKFYVSMLRRGMGDMYEPHYMVRDEGTTLPADYRFTPPDGKEGLRYFRLAGESLRLYEEHKAQKEHAQKMRDQFVESVGGDGSYGYQGDEITHVEFKHRVPPNWISQRQSKRTETDDDGNWVDIDVFDCVPDTSTEEGRKIAQRMKGFPHEPDSHDLQKSWTPNAPHMPQPQWDYYSSNDGDSKIVYYNPDEIDGELVPPPDAVELKNYFVEWLSESKRDIAMGIKPPPMPEALKMEIQSELDKKNKKQARRPGFPPS